MKNRSEYRAQAREILSGQWKNAAMIGAIFLVFTLLVEVPSLCVLHAGTTIQNATNGFTMLYSFLILVPLEFAMLCAFLNFTRGEITSDGLCQDTLNHFKAHWSRVVPTYLLEGVIILGLSIVTLGIAGIIFAYAYSMVPYLLKDYPELSPKEALRASREMMKGHKWEFFLLQLSFIGWIILSILTACIGLIFLEPYIATTNAYYYEDLKAETIIEN